MEEIASSIWNFDSVRLFKLATSIEWRANRPEIKYMD